MEATNKVFASIEKKEDGSLMAFASTPAKDRDGDVIQWDAWELDNYLKNPVIQPFHDYRAFPVGKATDIQMTEDGLIFTPVFADGTQEGKDAQYLYQNGFLNAFSVGFIVKDGYMDKAEASYNITKAELLEISIVPVPANQEALRLAYDNVQSKAFKGFVEDALNKKEVDEMVEWIKANKEAIELLIQSNKNVEIKQEEIPTPDNNQTKEELQKTLREYEDRIEKVMKLRTKGILS